MSLIQSSSNEIQTDVSIEEDKIKIHESLVLGKLNNGMDYYILPCPSALQLEQRNNNSNGSSPYGSPKPSPNCSPKGSPKTTRKSLPKALELRLIIKVGSLMEEDDEQGIIHFIEHLGFKGTDSYGSYELVKELEKLGIVYGADINASTHLLETKFRLSLIVDESFEQLRLGLKIMNEWAFHIRISEQDVEEEKSVILSEYRAKQGLSQRLLNTYWDSIFNDKLNSVDKEGSNLLSRRMPIGIPEVFMDVSHQKIRDVYKKWFKPENMAVLIVGDFSERIDEAEALLKEIMNCGCNINNDDINNNEESNHNKDLSSYITLPSHHSKDIILSLCDDELTSSQLSFEFFYPRPTSNTLSFVKEEVLLRLTCSIVDRRLAGIAKGYGSSGNNNRHSFTSAGISNRELVKGLSVIGITAIIETPSNNPDKSTKSKSNNNRERSSSLLTNPPLHRGIYNCMQTILLEMRRLSELGIFEDELVRAKESWFHVFTEQKRLGLGGSKQSAATIASDLEGYILSNNDSVFTSQYIEGTLLLDCLNDITLTEIDQFIKKSLDMHKDESDSEYYLKGGFRMVSASFPKNKNTNEQDIDISQMLIDAREYCTSVSPLEQWGNTSKLTPDDVISTAKYALSLQKSNLEKNSQNDPNNFLSPIPVLEECRIDRLKDNRLRCQRSNCGCNMTSFLPPSMLELPEVKNNREENSSIPPPLLLPPSELSTKKFTALTGPIISHLPTIDAYEVLLGNGIKVCLRWMDGESTNSGDSNSDGASDKPVGGKISFQAFALGGSTELNEVEDAVFSMLDDVANVSDIEVHHSSSYKPNQHDILETLPAIDIQELQSRYKTRVNIQRHTYHRGIGGSCPSEHLELLLSLITLKFSSQSFDLESFNRMKNLKLAGLEYRDNSPEFIFMDRARINACGDVPISRPLSDEVIQNMNIDTAKDLYNRAFMNDPTEFFFVFIGDLPPKEEFIPLLQEYLGRMEPSHIPASLSINRDKEMDTEQSQSSDVISSSSVSSSSSSSSSSSCNRKWVNKPTFRSSIQTNGEISSLSNVRKYVTPYPAVFPTTIVHEKVFKRVADKASTLIIFRADLPFHSDRDEVIEWLLLDIACRMLQSKLLDVLRIQLGKVYNVAVEASKNSLDTFALISCVFHCDPTDLEQVHAVVKNVIESYQNNSNNNDIQNIANDNEEVISLDSLLGGIKEALINSHVKTLNNPSYWLFWILDSYKAYVILGLGLSNPDIKHKSNSTSSISVSAVGSHSSQWVDTAVSLRSLDKESLIQDLCASTSSSNSGHKLRSLITKHFNLNSYVRMDLLPISNPNISIPSINDNNGDLSSINIDDKEGGDLKANSSEPVFVHS
jgi:predicted Zn-dependent peptidase